MAFLQNHFQCPPILGARRDLKDLVMQNRNLEYWERRCGFNTKHQITEENPSGQTDVALGPPPATPWGSRGLRSTNAARNDHCRWRRPRRMLGGSPPSHHSLASQTPGSQLTSHTAQCPRRPVYTRVGRLFRASGPEARKRRPTAMSNRGSARKRA